RRARRGPHRWAAARGRRVPRPRRRRRPVLAEACKFRRERRRRHDRRRPRADGRGAATRPRALRRHARARGPGAGRRRMARVVGPGGRPMPARAAARPHVARRRIRLTKKARIWRRRAVLVIALFGLLVALYMLWFRHSSFVAVRSVEVSGVTSRNG